MAGKGGIHLSNRCLSVTVALLVLLSPSIVFACLESYTSVPVHFSGSVDSASIFRSNIVQNYYFARGLLDRKVKVPAKPSTPVYFWVVPHAQGWQIKIGPRKDLIPDYIGITTWPREPDPRLFIDVSTRQQSHPFCFNMEPEDYDYAIHEIRETGKSGMVDSFSAECRSTDHDENVGRGVLTIRNISAKRLDFTVDLTVPVYTTDCPPPKNFHEPQ
jgi:hypothetical protein